MSVLDEIVLGVREDLARRIAEVPERELSARLGDTDPVRDPMPAFGEPGLSVIAEVKRRSPSKGNLAAISDPAELAQTYELGGAAAISVLTEERRFGGSLADLRRVRAAVEVPLLRKDFIVTTYQLIEARVSGADLVLLIVAALDDEQLPRLFDAATELGLTAVVEVHDEIETERAIELGAMVVGVNARSLQTLEVDLSTFGRLAPMIPEHVVKVAESGIAGPNDAARFAREGASAVLVGEALVTEASPAAAIEAMRTVSAGSVPV
ncbi:MAG: indole-3-glycerol phosphate synthase TrpC [Nocardioides sp.]